MIVIIKIFRFIIVCILLIDFFCDKYKNYAKKNQKWNYLKIADWIFYFGGLSSIIMSFGLVAALETPQECDEGIREIFLVVCVTGMLLMLLQKVWRVKYDEDKIVFRNSFGITRIYNNKGKHIVFGERVTRVTEDGKVIIEWPSGLMDLEQEVNFGRYLEKNKKGN